MKVMYVLKLEMLNMTPARVSQILDLLFNAQPFDSEFTRGLYYTNN